MSRRFRESAGEALACFALCTLPFLWAVVALVWIVRLSLAHAEDRSQPSAPAKRDVAVRHPVGGMPS